MEKRRKLEPLEQFIQRQYGNRGVKREKFEKGYIKFKSEMLANRSEVKKELAKNSK